MPAIVLDHLTPAQRRAYGIADNKLALNAGWNEELLAAEQHALNGEGFDLPLLGFDEAELDRLLAPAPLAAGGDAAGRLSCPSSLCRGRAICGASAGTACSAAAAPIRRRSRAMATDPPYGVDCDPGRRDEAGVSAAARAGPRTGSLCRCNCR